MWRIFLFLVITVIFMQAMEEPASKKELWHYSSGESATEYEAKKSVIAFDNPIRAFAWHPKQEILAVAGIDDKGIVHFVEGGSISSSIETNNPYIEELAWDSEGERLAIWSFNKKITIYAKKDRSKLQELMPNGWAKKMLWSAKPMPFHNKKLVVNRIHLDQHSFGDGSTLYAFSYDYPHIRDIAIYPTGEFLALAESPGAFYRKVTIRSVNNNATQNDFRTKSMNAITLHLKGELLTYGGGDGEIIIHPRDQRFKLTFDYDDIIDDLAWSADGRFLAVATNKKVVVHDMEPIVLALIDSQKKDADSNQAEESEVANNNNNS